MGVGVSYGLAIRDVMRNFRGLDVRIELDGVILERERVASVLVTKVPYYGLGLRMAPYARIDDGLLHVRIIPMRIAREHLPSILSSGVGGVYVGEHHRAMHALLETDVAEMVQFDGDIAGERLINRFSVLPGQVKMRY
jgi:diacylglycerol kinase family enzyme